MTILWSTFFPIPNTTSLLLYARCDQSTAGAPKSFSAWLVDATAHLVWFSHTTNVLDLAPAALQQQRQPPPQEPTTAGPPSSSSSSISDEDLRNASGAVRQNSNNNNQAEGERYDDLLERVLLGLDRSEDSAAVAAPAAFSSGGGATRVANQQLSSSTADVDGRKGATAAQRLLLLYPTVPTKETLVARLEVRMTLRGGAAAISLCTLHCSLLQDSDLQKEGTSSMLVFLQNLSEDMKSVSLLRRSHTQFVDERALHEKRHETMVQIALAKEEQLLAQFLVLLNEKKKKIRELEEALHHALTTAAPQPHTAVVQQVCDEAPDSPEDEESDHDVTVVSVEPPATRKRPREDDAPPTTTTSTTGAPPPPRQISGLMRDSQERREDVGVGMPTTQQEPALQNCGSHDSLVGRRGEDASSESPMGRRSESLTNLLNY